MADYAQTQNTGNLQKFIKEIPGRGTPEKVTTAYIIGLGFKSVNDRSIISVLKFVGILDNSGIPSSKYAGLRNRAEAPKLLAHLIQTSYIELFKTYPDANKQSPETLKNWFSSRTTVGEASMKNIVQTFLALCGIAEFDQEFDPSVLPATSPSVSVAHPQTRKNSLPSAQVCFNIQVHIPGEQKPEVYESIFKNLGKYVLGIQESE